VLPAYNILHLGFSLFCSVIFFPFRLSRLRRGRRVHGVEFLITLNSHTLVCPQVTRRCRLDVYRTPSQTFVATRDLPTRNPVYQENNPTSGIDLPSRRSNRWSVHPAPVCTPLGPATNRLCVRTYCGNIK